MLTALERLTAFPLALKAVPKLEAGQRIIYCEPSNEGTDLEGERVLREALRDSRDYFLAKGNFDIDHLTIRGYQMPHIDNPRLWEIGRPTEVRFDDRRTFVKGFIYQGTGPMAQKANEFWSSLTELEPPMVWYPSVGGHIREAGTILPKGEAVPVRAIRKVFWNNVGFSREPVNPTVPGVSLMPLGEFAKCWIGAGSRLDYTPVAKAIDAGYGTDVASLTGGGALRRESLHGDPRYRAAVVRLEGAMRTGDLAPRGDKLTVCDLVDYLMDQGLVQDEALTIVRQFLSDLSTQRKEHAHVG